MNALWPRLDQAHETEPLRGPEQNAALTRVFFDWLDDRLVRDDALAELRSALPGVSDEVLLSVVGAVCRVVRMP